MRIATAARALGTGASAAGAFARASVAGAFPAGAAGAFARASVAGAFPAGAFAAGALASALVLTGCNGFLDNRNFQGPGSDDAATGDGPGGDAGVDGAPVDACSGIGCMVTNCASQGKAPTSVSGTVRTPDGGLPLYNALVYIPTAALDPIGDGPASPACASGAPLMHAFTDVSGHFKLDGVPSVPNLPLVIQVGKWRREVTIAAVADCQELVLPSNDTRLPKNSSEGHLPRIAVTTGAAESLECVGRGLGISDSEHTIGTGAGRIHLYAGEGSTTTMLGAATLEPVTVLYGRMAQYDMLLFSCDGRAIARPSTVVQGLLDYVNARGWVWLSHFHSNWVAPPTPFPAFAMFNVGGTDPPSPVTARIDTTTPRGQVFADWMALVGASQQPGLVSIENGRNTCLGVDATMAQRQIYFDPVVSNNFNGVQLLTWVPGSGGRLLFSDIHLQLPVGGQTTFPAECQPGSPTPQGKSIAFQLFDQPTCLP